MHLTPGRIISLPIAVSLLVCNVSGETIQLAQRSTAEIAFRNVAYLAFALALIWYSERVAAAGAYFVRGHDSQETPARLVYLAGWFFLIVPPVLTYALNR